MAKRIRRAVTRSRPLGFLVIVVLAIAACSSSPAVDPRSLIGQPAPVLTGTDLTGSGVTDLAALKGKPTGVVFWLNTCPHCQTALPEIQASWPASAAGANILTVGMKNTGVAGPAGFEDPAALVKTTGLTLPTIETELDQTATAWRFQGVPIAFVLDAGHVVRDVLIGEDEVLTIGEALANPPAS